MKSLRWWMIGLLMIGSIINYLTRSTLGVAAPTILQDLHITAQQYSWIVSTFQGAIMLQPICGYVLDVVGLKTGFAMFAIAWSLVSMAHGLARSWPAFAVLRGLLGFAEGCANPAGMKATAEWFPARERGLAGGLFNIGASVGSMLAPPARRVGHSRLQLAGGVRHDRPHRSRVGGAVAGLLPLARSPSEALRRGTRAHRLGAGTAPQR
jgi:ACS family hexuronate transporter-like MFS transporter